MIVTLLCLAFPALLIYAAWSDVRSMTINNWVSIVLAAAFVPAAAASGMSLQQFGSHLGFAAIALLIGAVLFYLNVFGGGDAKVIAAASIWMGFAGAGRFFFLMAVCGGHAGIRLDCSSPDQDFLRRRPGPTRSCRQRKALRMLSRSVRRRAARSACITGSCRGAQRHGLWRDSLRH